MIESRRAPVLLTVGDPNGIGPEIAVKAAISLFDNKELRPVIIGERYLVEPFARQAGFGIEVQKKNWGECGKSIDLLTVDHMAPTDFSPGTVSAAAGKATVAYVQTALEQLQENFGRAIVGCPHCEIAVNSSGRNFSGYPSLLSELLDIGPDNVFLMLIGGGLRIVHATLHESVSSSLSRLSPELIEKAAVAADRALRNLGIEKPKIGLFGINPHAGENGLFGSEDNLISVPAASLIRARGIDICGPQGADTMLARNDIDVFVAMYHDQGHIPVKLLAGRNASALTIGGGIMFSSVGHGAAFDIAGQNIADPEAVIRAIHLVGGVG
ncbi:MAG: 4-hydroxythreonine-4-phosphate dehydrogenase PdxA [Rhizobiaceae bacterium]